MEALQKNIQAILQHSNATREIVRKIEADLTLARNDNTMLADKVALLESQVQSLQVRLYTGGASDGNND